MIDVLDAGFAPDVVPYLDGWALQRHIHAQVRDGKRSETLILLEHEPVFTAGSRTRPEDRPRGSDIPVIDVDRGGRITWHGPGQLVGYPIMRVADRGDAVACVRAIEQLLIDVLRRYGVDGRRIEGRSGVWVDRGAEPAAKIAAIGMRVQQGVTMHGFALNCDNPLAPFEQIVPCGLSDARTTTIAREAGRDLSPRDVKDAVADAFRTVFERTPA
ncbi:lipoyl(octanoyl) transferase LipB [Microbacterium sp. Marseille-Q6965]|uniref:lipoyl(octanoyl) transferase LipB n=1 Tax=Microbacterium sp. Marseille-Q6965 TaxID=2965072 RepID=UPI0021B6F517|nr:lipoyl(octanoyl) transferase LipB [Microbacterium sp. Marseille-Q6965]